MGRRRKEKIANFSSIAEALEAIEIDENADPLQVENDLFALVSENIDNAEESSLISAEQADQLRAELIQEHRERLEEMYELDEGFLPVDNDDDDDDDDDDDNYDEDDEALYHYSTDLATFSAGNAFANVLLGIGEDLGYEDVESFAIDLADAMGLEDEEAVGLVTGQLVPDEDVFEELAIALDLDDQTFEDMADIAAEVREEIYALEDVETDEADVEAAVAYSRYNDRRVSELEAQIAEFNTNQAISDQLSGLERDIDFCIDSGWMPPYAKQLLIGDFERDSDQVAAFSEVCLANKVDPETELYSLRRVVETFKRCFEHNPIAMFGSEIHDPVTPLDQARESEVWTRAQQNVALRKGQIGTTVR